MGPSGAGKTTLLNVLSAEPGEGRIEHISGDVLLNGQPLSRAIVREHCAYLEQNDVGLFPYLSCEDHVRALLSSGHKLPSRPSRPSQPFRLATPTRFHHPDRCALLSRFTAAISHRMQLRT